MTIYIQVSQEECARLREGVPYGKVYRYNPKHPCPKWKGYGDNGQRKVWSSGGSMQCSYQLTNVIIVFECGVISPDTSSCEWFRMHSQQYYVSVCQSIVLGNPKDNYDMRGSFLVVQFNGFMSLTS
jgi:hypothetical protein